MVLRGAGREGGYWEVRAACWGRRAGGGGVSFVWAKIRLGKDIGRQKGLEERGWFPVCSVGCPVMTPKS